MKKVIRSLQLLIVPLLFYACSDNEFIPKTTSFNLNVKGQGALAFRNPECEFDNRKNQSQFTYSAPSAYVLFSTYLNTDQKNKTTSQIWINVLIENVEQSSFNSDTLRSILRNENSSLNTKYFIPIIEVELGGNRYDSRIVNNNSNFPPYWINSSFNYLIEDYEVLYKSDCVARKLLYLNLTIDGMLYKHEFSKALDSICLDKTRMKILFDME